MKQEQEDADAAEAAAFAKGFPSFASFFFEPQMNANGREWARHEWLLRRRMEGETEAREARGWAPGVQSDQTSSLPRAGLFYGLTPTKAGRAWRSARGISSISSNAAAAYKNLASRRSSAATALARACA